MLAECDWLAPSGVGSPLYLQGEHAQALLIEALRIPACRPPLPCHGAWPLVQRALQWDCRLRPSMADLATAISAYGFAPAASVDGLPPVAGASPACQCMGTVRFLGLQEKATSPCPGSTMGALRYPPCEDLICVGGASVRPSSVAASAGRLVRASAAAVLGGGATSAGPKQNLCRGARSGMHMGSRHCQARGRHW